MSDMSEFDIDGALVELIELALCGNQAGAIDASNEIQRQYEAAIASAHREAVGVVAFDAIGEQQVTAIKWTGDYTPKQGDKIFTHAPDSAARIAELEAENAKLKMAIEYDQSDDDAEWEPPHPIFQLAQERDNFMNRVIELQKELEKARKDAPVAKVFERFTAASEHGMFAYTVYSDHEFSVGDFLKGSL